MKSAIQQLGTMPDGRLHHLVRAACVDTETKAEWLIYAKMMGSDFPNEGELRLYPLIANRLGGDLNQYPLAKYLKSTQRWARMQAMVNKSLSAQVAQQFKQSNTPLLWTKGAAIVARTDQRPELRPSSDIDGLIRWENIDTILEIGATNGWKQKKGLMANRTKAQYANTELSYYIGARGMVDLQWMPRLSFAYDRDIQQWLWQSSNPRVYSENIPVANDTWLLLETIDHGLSANAVYPIRWIVDGVRLLKARHDTIDWQMFLTIIKRNQLDYVFAKGLQVLARYSPHIPADILENLTSHRGSFLDKEEFKARMCILDLDANYLARRLLTKIRREPAKIYAVSVPNPMDRRMPVSPVIRLLAAARNIYARITYPFRRG